MKEWRFKANSHWFLIIGIAISLWMHWPHLQKDFISIHVWRQTYTVSNIINFAEEDPNIFHPRINDRGATDGIYPLEFPLMQWLIAQAIRFNIANDIVIIRLCMFLISVLTVWGMRNWIRNLLHDKVVANMTAAVFIFSPSFFYYSINPLPDMLSLMCCIWGLYFFSANQFQLKNTICAAFFFSIAALCKLPYILFYVLPFAEIILSQPILRNKLIWNNENIKDRNNLPKANTEEYNSFSVFVIFLISIIPVVAWYTYAIPKWKTLPIVGGMFDDQFDFHEIYENLSHNIISNFPELLLNYSMLIPFVIGLISLLHFSDKILNLIKRFSPSIFHAIVLKYGEKRKTISRTIVTQWTFLFIALLAYYFYEINAIGKIHDYYLMPFFPLIFRTVGIGLQKMNESRRLILRLLLCLCILFAPIACYLRMQSRWHVENPGFNKDWLVYKKSLRDATSDRDLTIVANDESHCIAFYYIHKKGWCIEHDWVSEEQWREMLHQGAKYLFSDSRTLEQRPDIAPHLVHNIGEFGSIRIFELK
jgi:hypothetical protein